MSASVLISEPNHFRFELIDNGLEPLQKLVGGYIEAVTDPHGEWHLYIDEEGKIKNKRINVDSTRFVDELFTDSGNMPFSAFDVLVGTVVWLGPMVTVGDTDEHTFPGSLVTRFLHSTLRQHNPATPIVVIEHGDTVTVFDQPTDSIPEIEALVDQTRLAVTDGGQHDVISVFPNMSRTKWVEIRVELMDRPAIQIRDKRQDKSYG